MLTKAVESNLKKVKTSDLRVGMYVSKIDSSWLTNPFFFVLENFKITSQREIQKLAGYDIKSVYIDTDKGVDLEIHHEAEDFEDLTGTATFPVSVNDLVVGREVPVDFYRRDGAGEMHLVLKSGLVYREEVSEIFQQQSITTLYVPLSQKKDFDVYKKQMEDTRERQKNIGYQGEFLDPRKVGAYYRFIDNYHVINLRALIPGTRPEFDIFRRYKEIITPLVKKREPIDGDKLDIWISENVNTVIDKADEEAYHAYLFTHAKESKNPLARAAFVRENSRLIVEQLAQSPRSERLMHDTKMSVTELTQSIIENPTTFYGLMKINNYDYYTFTHSVNVATLSLALAMATGVMSRDDLTDLGLGAILHDLGKSKINRAIVNKPGKLTDNEFKEITEHVVLGYDMLRFNRMVPERALHPLLEHHERLSGKGYPKNLSGAQIHLFGRITGLIDIYDALTTERSYKKAWKPFDALAMISKSEGDFDKGLFALFVRLIHKQEV